MTGVCARLIPRRSTQSACCLESWRKFLVGTGQRSFACNASADLCTATRSGFSVATRRASSSVERRAATTAVKPVETGHRESGGSSATVPLRAEVDVESNTSPPRRPVHGAQFSFPPCDNVQAASLPTIGALLEQDRMAAEAAGITVASREAKRRDEARADLQRARAERQVPRAFAAGRFAPTNGPRQPAFRRREFVAMDKWKVLGEEIRRADVPRPRPRQGVEAQPSIAHPSPTHSVVEGTTGYKVPTRDIQYEKRLQAQLALLPDEAPFALRIQHPLIRDEEQMRTIFAGCSPVELKSYRKNELQFVLFARRNDIVAALDLNAVAIQLDGKRVRVRADVATRFGHIAQCLRRPPYTAYLKDLPDGCTGESLCELFARFAPTACVVNTARSGDVYALMTFADADRLQAVFEAHYTSEIGRVAVHPHVTRRF